tara:strand:- start:1025 stop:1276 length:252 start_codon:yes stop_codon:yes gene_type:complete
MINEIDNLDTANLTNDEIAIKSAHAIEGLQSASGRLHELQEYCRHDEVKVDLIEGHLKLVCKFCNGVVGYPTKEQQIAAGYIL